MGHRGIRRSPLSKDYVNVLSGNFQIDERNLAFKYSKFKTDQAKTEKKATKKNISVELTDSWGDGWNGVEVFQKDTDGKLQNTLTLETGSEATKQISVQCGKEITFEAAKKDNTTMKYRSRLVTKPIQTAQNTRETTRGG